MRRRALAIAAAIAAIASPAYAAPAPAPDDPEASIPIALPGHPPDSADLDELVGLGLRFWHDRDVRPCAPDVIITPGLVRLYRADAAAVLSRCEVLLDPERERDVAGAGDAPIYDVDGAPLDSRARDEYVCAVVFHELGHLGGVKHAQGAGLMSGRGGAWIVTPAAPWACRVWARDRARARAVVAKLNRLLRPPHRQPRAKVGMRFGNSG